MKEVIPETDEGPTPKKLHAARDSEFMVNRILAMAKVYASPRGSSLPAADLSPKLREPLHSPGLLVISPELGPIHVTDSTEESKDRFILLVKYYMGQKSDIRALRNWHTLW